MSSLAQPRLKLMGAPRDTKPGVYHTTDLLRKPARTIAAWHLGKEAPEGIDGWPAKRGKALEEAAMDVMGIPEPCRQPEIWLDLEDGGSIVGHPEYVAGIVQGEPYEAVHPWQESDYDHLEMGEAKSQMRADDPARQDLAIEQALGYDGLIRLGGELHLDGVPWLEDVHGPLNIEQVRPIMAGLWDLEDDEATQTVNPAASKALAEYMVEKARAVHEAVQKKDLSIAEAFDAERPPRIEDAQGPPPIADGEEAKVAEETILAKVAMDYLEEEFYDDGRDRFLARWEEQWEEAGEPCLSEADLETRIASPTGGRVQLWTRTEKEVYPSDTLEELREQKQELEAELEEKKQAAIEEALEENQDLVAELDQVNEELEAEKEACTEEKKVPHYARVCGHGDLDPREALQQLVDGGAS